MSDYTQRATSLLAELGIAESHPDYWTFARALNAALGAAHAAGRAEQAREVAEALHRIGVIELPRCECGELLPNHKPWCESKRAP